VRAAEGRQEVEARREDPRDDARGDVGEAEDAREIERDRDEDAIPSGALEELDEVRGPECTRIPGHALRTVLPKRSGSHPLRAGLRRCTLRAVMRLLTIVAALAAGAIVGASCLIDVEHRIACGDGYVDPLAGEECDPQVPESFINACEHTNHPHGTAACDPE